ncbi:uncharacterized protein ACIB01_014077 isoform 1-T1 [Guaruba guarouba]
MSLARHLEMISLPCIQPPGSAVDEVSPLQCLADCRYNNHFTQCRTGTTLGKAMAAVKQHIRNRCSSSTHHEGICAAGVFVADGANGHVSSGLRPSTEPWRHDPKRRHLVFVSMN